MSLICFSMPIQPFATAATLYILAKWRKCCRVRRCPGRPNLCRLPEYFFRDNWRIPVCPTVSFVSQNAAYSIFIPFCIILVVLYAFGDHRLSDLLERISCKVRCENVLHYCPLLCVYHDVAVSNRVTKRKVSFFHCRCSFRCKPFGSTNTKASLLTTIFFTIVLIASSSNSVNAVWFCI